MASRAPAGLQRISKSSTSIYKSAHQSVRRSSQQTNAAAQNRDVFPVHEKYTVGSTGIWEKIRVFFAVDANRSTGIPLNPQFRNPPPGALDPNSYDDPYTVPAADIADNPYWKRDNRRNYPQVSRVTQADAVGLLTMGNVAKPSEKLLAGEEGSKQLVLAKQEGEEKGLAQVFEKQSALGNVLDADGSPPFPPGRGREASKNYILQEVQSYKNEYPCRNFN